MSPASNDSDQTGASNLSKIESLRQKLTPILVSSSSSNQNRNASSAPPRPNLTSATNNSTTRKHDTELPFPSASKSVDSESDFTRAKYGEMLQKSGLFRIGGEEKFIEQKDFLKKNQLGSGSCGIVYKMEHIPTKTKLAVKVMRRTTSNEENKRIIMDLDVLVKSYDFPCIVRCFGYFVQETEVWICMELMASCFDKLMKLIKQSIPEDILGKLTFSTVTALSYLKEKHGIMHRDVKPSNILIDEQGNIKLCDFGISGVLIDSMAKSSNPGCAAFMSPERINPPDQNKPDYDIRADIWSLGISLIELATTVHPYSESKGFFDVMARIVTEDSPQLPANCKCSDDFRSFVNTCLIKDYRKRPKYRELMLEPFFVLSKEQPVDVGQWYREVTNTVE